MLFTRLYGMCAAMRANLGDGGEVAGGVNGRYGTKPIIKLYLATSGRYPPLPKKIIAATGSEAAPVLDALLETDAGLDIVRHHVDAGGVATSSSHLVMHLALPSCLVFLISTRYASIIFVPRKSKALFRMSWATLSTPISSEHIGSTFCAS